LAGEFSGQIFKEKYSFLVDIHRNELKTLRGNLKQARKLLLTSPHDLRLERELEVNRLEMAVKRGESAVNQDTREKVEQEALSKMSKQEREKRKQGKGKWWMKECECYSCSLTCPEIDDGIIVADKKDLLVRARFEALATGGKMAVKKAIEKKQKKISQKEKKSRPFARIQAGGKRSSSSLNSREGGRLNKRRRVDI
jgi:ribosomal RNA-processing protein 36